MHRFRGAVAELAGRNNFMYHMHDNSDPDNPQLVNAYPLIHYRKNVGLASMFAINEGAEQLLSDYQSGMFDRFKMGNFHRSIKAVEEPKIISHDLKLYKVKKYNTYRMYRGLILNHDNYRKYKDLPGSIQKAEFVQALLGKHLNGFAREMQWNWNRPQGEWLEVIVCDIDRTTKVNFRGRDLMAFDLVLKVNAKLPPLIAIGAGVSAGFGWLLPLDDK